LQRLDHAEAKVTAIETHLPTMFQEILDYYFDNRIASAVSSFVTKADLEKYSTPKLDRVVFDEYVRRQ